MVVTSKACETTAVVFPRRLLSLSAINVGSWAHFGTDATAHTTICFNPKSLVANELSFEKLTYNTAVYAWPSSHIGFFFYFLSLDNLCNDGCQMYLGWMFFLSLFFDSVYIHERQTHITLGHEQRKHGI